VKFQISEYVEKDLNLHPILFDREGILGKGILENIEDLTEQCSKAIIILTKDDEQKSGAIRARQNVIHELGYCQGKYGREKVAVLIERGTEIPSNIRGEFFVEFDKDNLDVCLVRLLRHFKPLERKR
jgi:predicted nucleotide-binding protein